MTKQYKRNKIKEIIIVVLILAGFSIFLTYGCVKAIVKQGNVYNLTDIKPVKLYTDCEFDKSIGINVSKELCEVE